MTIAEYPAALDALDEAGFAAYRTDFGGDFATRRQYVDDFVHHPEHERRICQLLGLKTEEEKLTDASLVSARAAADSARSKPWLRHPIISSVIATLVAAAIIGGVSRWIRGDVAQSDQPPASGEAVDAEVIREVPVVLRQASGGGETGRFYSTPEEWYWLISRLTVINQSETGETGSFELHVPVGRGVTRHLQPIATPPAQIDLPTGTRLLGVEDIPGGASITGGLLFSFYRLNFEEALEIDSETGETHGMNAPRTRGATIVVTSELFPEREPRRFDSFSLVRGQFRQ